MNIVRVYRPSRATVQIKRWKRLIRAQRVMDLCESVISFFADIVHVLSVLFVIGVFGGVEQGTIADWKLAPILALVLVINVAFRMIYKAMMK